MPHKGFMQNAKRNAWFLVGMVFGGTNGGGKANEESDVTELPNEVDMNSLTFIMSTPLVNSSAWTDE
jgi:hypothetical protein